MKSQLDSRCPLAWTHADFNKRHARINRRLFGWHEWMSGSYSRNSVSRRIRAWMRLTDNCSPFSISTS